MDFRKMYFSMFNEITQALRAMEQNNYGIARDILIQAQIKGEEAYIDADACDEEEKKQEQVPQ